MTVKKKPGTEGFLLWPLVLLVMLFATLFLKEALYDPSDLPGSSRALLNRFEARRLARWAFLVSTAFGPAGRGTVECRRDDRYVAVCWLPPCDGSTTIPGDSTVGGEDFRATAGSSGKRTYTVARFHPVETVTVLRRSTGTLPDTPVKEPVQLWVAARSGKAWCCALYRFITGDRIERISTTSPATPARLARLLDLRMKESSRRRAALARSTPVEIGRLLDGMADDHETTGILSRIEEAIPADNARRSESMSTRVPARS